MSAVREHAAGGLGALVAALLLAGCSSIQGTYPRTGAIVPDAAVQLTPGKALALEKLVAIGAGAYAIHVVYDPLAPNWSIEEGEAGEDLFHVALKAKRYRVGGDGEAMNVVRRRALQLQRERGALGYRILDFSEGIDSGTPIAQRYAEASIQLVRSAP